MNTDVKNYAVFIIAQVLRVIFSTLAMGILARFLGPEGLGRWAMITAAATLMHLFFLNWMQQDAFIKYGREEWSRTHHVGKAWLARLPIVVAGLALAGFLLVAAPGQWTHALFLLSPHEQVLALASLLSLLISVEIQSLLQITNRMRTLALVPVWIAAGGMLLYGGLYIGSPPNHRLGLALLGSVVLTCAAWLCGGIVGNVKASIQWTPWDRSVTQRMILYAWPGIPGALLGYFVNWGNQVLLRQTLSSREVGLYQSAFQVHALIMAFAIPLTTLILPKLIDRQLEDASASARYVSTIVPTIFGLWLVVLIPMVTCLPFVFSWVYGASYSSAIPVLTAFLISTPLCALGQLYTVLYNVHARMDKILVISIIMVMINIALIGSLLPHVTPRRFALAFSAAYASGQYLMCLYQHYALKVPPHKIHAMMAAAALFLIPQTFIFRWDLRMVCGLASLVVLIAVFRGFDILNPKRSKPSASDGSEARMIAAWAGVFSLALILRVLPTLRASHSAGVDHWFWKAYIDAVRKDRRFPPHLPNYLFDVGQWCPPLFPLALARLSDRAFERSARWIAVVADLARLGFLLATVYAMGGRNPWIYAVAGLAYATTPIATVYNLQLNPRGFAALLMDVVLVLMIVGADKVSPWILWSIPAFLCALIFLLHKMTTQIIVFVLIGMTLWSYQLHFLWPIPLGMLIAWVISRGFYVQVLKAHWDIVWFWTREWPLLEADPLRDSPLYGQPGYRGSSRQFVPGARNAIKHLMSLFVGNYAPFVAGAVILTLLVPSTDPALRGIMAWMGLCLIFAVATVMVPMLRGLGFGNLYLYNAAFPAALVLGFDAVLHPRLAGLLVPFLLILNLLVLVRAYTYMRGHKGLSLPQDLLRQIAQSGPGTWMSFPMQLMEHIAYLANKPVLWGAHGYGFYALHKIFPVLRTEFRDLMRDYGLRFLLIHESYRPDIDAIGVPRREVFTSNGYVIYELLNEKGTTRT